MAIDKDRLALHAVPNRYHGRNILAALRLDRVAGRFGRHCYRLIHQIRSAAVYDVRPDIAAHIPCKSRLTFKGQRRYITGHCDCCGVMIMFAVEFRAKG